MSLLIQRRIIMSGSESSPLLVSRLYNDVICVMYIMTNNYVSLNAMTIIQTFLHSNKHPIKEIPTSLFTFYITSFPLFSVLANRDGSISLFRF